MQSLAHLMTNMNSVFNANKQIEILKEYCCMRCGGHVKVAKVTIPFGPHAGDIVTEKSGCNCEVIEIVKTNQRQAKMNRLQSIFNDNSLINDALKGATFENYTANHFASQFKQARQYADSFNLKSPGNLMFQGSFGTGKSHLSVAIIKAVINKGYSAIFISVPKLLTKIRNTYNKQSEHTEEDVIRAISSVDLVVFDDLGAEGFDGWPIRKLFEIIDQRAGKHNVFTTNLNQNELVGTTDLERNFSRIMEGMKLSDIVMMDGPDYRLRHLRKGINS